MSRAKRPTPIQREDLERMVFVGDPRIDPSGSMIYFVHRTIDAAKNRYLSNLWTVATTTAGSKRAGAASGPSPFTSGDDDSMPRVSPDGSLVAFVRRPKGEPHQVWLIPTDGGEARALTDLPEGTIASVEWFPDGKSLAISFRERSREFTAAAASERNENGASDPPMVIDDWWYRLDGDGYFGADRFVLMTVDTTTGDHTTIYDQDTMGSFTFDIAPNGKSIAITTNTDPKAMIRAARDRIVLLDVASGKTKSLDDLPPGPKTGVRFSPDGKHLAWAGRRGRRGAYDVENLELWIAGRDGRNARALSGHLDVCLMAVGLTDVSAASFAPHLFWDADGSRVFFRCGTRGESHLASLSVKGKNPALVVHTDPGVVYEPGERCRSGDGMLIPAVRATPTTPPEVCVVRPSVKSGKTAILSDFNGGWLSERQVADIESHEIETADGTMVHTWVMRPPQDAGRARLPKRPAILEVHGGPHAQYSIGFFHEFQVLAAQGYTVVFSNPRGSKGYGRDHCAAIKGNWGTADWTDIEAVLAFMQDDRAMDSDRLGIMGGSYGGYMTNWAIGHTDAFCAAITDRCVSNVVTMGGTSDYCDEPDGAFAGNFWDDIDTRWNQSPIQFIGQASTPTLIIHSEGDLRCNIEQAEQLFVALKLLDVPTRFIRYPRSTSHGMSRGGPPDLRQHRLAAILEWWKDYLGE